MIIRPAVSNDIEQITEIYNQAIRSGGKTADLTEFSASERTAWFEYLQADNRFTILVAEEKQKVIGYAGLSPYRKGREALLRTAELSYYVHFDYHGQGIGSALLSACIQHSRKYGIKVLICILLAVNEVSFKFLEKHGFTPWGLLPDVAEVNGELVSHLYYGRKLDNE
ncbi:MAG: N-acetyltransferase family protein [Bacteroidota bacterium]|nr:N-acetyltransferase family protein [Bacteroidota bacterium]